LHYTALKILVLSDPKSTVINSKKQFAVIASNPLRFVSVDYIKMDYRRSVCGSHSIYYRIEKKGVLILRILGQQDTSKAF
jgi:toxin ParE1/3/4